MRDAFDFLGLDREADERAIKSAYAQALKRTRPESDPVGFQTLNEAYHRALDCARERADAPRPATPLQPLEPQAFFAVEADAAPVVMPRNPAAGAAPVPLEPLPATVLDWTDETSSQEPAAKLSDPPERVEWEAPAAPAQAAFRPTHANERFDFPAFFDTLTAQASHGDGSRLSEWLQGQPALWSLAVKTQAGAATMASLRATPTPMPDRCFDAILAFFDLDHVLAGQDALKLGRLRRRLHIEWLLCSAPQELVAEIRSAKPPVNLPPDRLARFLSGPFRWHSVLLQALPPNQPSEVAAFLRFLEEARVQRLPPAFDARRMLFWRRAGDRSAISWPRVAVGLARCLAITFIVALVDGVAAISKGGPAVLLLPLALGISLLWAAFITWTALSLWQGRPQEAFASAKGKAGFWLRLAFIPALAASALALRHLPATVAADKDPDAPMIAAGALVVLTVALATRRYRRRADSPPIAWTAAIGWRWIFVLPALKALVAAAALIVYYAEASAALAGAIWIADLWKQRRRLAA